MKSLSRLLTLGCFLNLCVTLHAQSAPSQTPSPPAKATTTVAAPPAGKRCAAAHKGLLVGCAVATVDLQDPKLIALIAGQFDCVTPEYEFMPEKLVDDKGMFTFSEKLEILIAAIGFDFG